MFHHDAPRPPVVPGEETESLAYSVESCASGSNKTYNPALTPRTSSLYQHSIQDGHAPLGFEPEGRSGSPPCSDSRSPPAYLLWARDLPSLLSDPDGVTLFKKYLMEEGKSYSDQLDFWFAIEGLHKQTDPERIGQYVKVIYRRYFLRSQLGISDSTRKTVQKNISDSRQCDTQSFDKAQEEVEWLINERTYPNFLRSEVYLSHVQSMQNVTNGSSGSSGPESHTGCGGTMLATLHEDQEMDFAAPPPSFAPLTKDMLMFTQKRRASDSVPKPEAFTGMYLHGKGAPKVYSSYNPVSRQDSELQSLSSDARTESDNLSLTDSSVDGTSVGGHHKLLARRQFQRHYRQVKESATLNREPFLHHTVIPRTQRVTRDQVHPMKPERFAQILIEKLETVKRNQEAEEKFAHKLLGNDDGCGPSAKSLADAIRERFGIDDDNDQDILDQHVSRVWSDLTPSRTPGLVSPRPRSPDALRRSRSSQSTPKACSAQAASLPPLHHQVPMHPYLTRSQHASRYLRKDRDGFSTFSSDSGNVNDFAEDKLHLPKSKSMPDYSDSTDTYSSMPSEYSGHDGRFRNSREWAGNRRHTSKKPELTDSGVSVVSESVSIGSHGHKDKVLSWLIQSDRSGCCSHADPDSEKASSCSGNSRFEGKHHTRPSTVRGRKSPPLTAPAQPFVADPSMPPLPPPHTFSQLDEARRRLEDQTRCKQSRQRCSQNSKQEMSASVGSTLRKSKENYTSVVFTFCDEEYPYLIKVPGTSLTLKQFKEYLPKKGNYRYFFKTECEELDMKVIQEEITDDNDVLPLWEGRVMAILKPSE